MSTLEDEDVPDLSRMPDHWSSVVLELSLSGYRPLGRNVSFQRVKGWETNLCAVPIQGIEVCRKATKYLPYKLTHSEVYLTLIPSSLNSVNAWQVGFHATGLSIN